MAKQHEQGDTSTEREKVERKKAELISITEDPAFQAKAYRWAYKFTGVHMDAEDDRQEALTRFIALVKNKASPGELERLDPARYVYAILHNMHVDRLRRTYRPGPQGNTRPSDQSQQDTPGKQGRQKYVLLAAQVGMSLEDIANRQQEESLARSTGLGMEEQVDSEMLVAAFIDSLPAELRELATLLGKEEYQLNELTQQLKLSYEELKYRKRRIREALRVFLKENALEEVR